MTIIGVWNAKSRFLDIGKMSGSRVLMQPVLSMPGSLRYIREGKSPDDQKTLHFVLIFLQISTFVFFQPHAELYKTIFHHTPIQG
jgi:hypothetical protein